ncbi:MAG: HAD-IA family hydrolase [Paracoccaceae bacterium]|nr:HAD-IA family hydrolase [Paracoccaceae bacterium]
MTAIRGVLFDKDGTLFDFHATWSSWARTFLTELASGDAARAAALGRAIGFDTGKALFEPESPIIAGTPGEIAAALLPHLPGTSAPVLIARMNAAAATAPMVEAVPLGPLLGLLSRLGLRLGVVTNDAEVPARAHLGRVGAERFFDFIAGFDSGFGAKPGPGALLAFADRFGLAPAEVAMVGDSRHDLAAARAAGMRPVAVLTGLAGEEDLAPFADAVLPDIGHLPRWLATLVPQESPA